MLAPVEVTEGVMSFLQMPPCSYVKLRMNIL